MHAVPTKVDGDIVAPPQQHNSVAAGKASLARLADVSRAVPDSRR